MSLVHGYLVGDVRTLVTADGAAMVMVESPYGVVAFDAELWFRGATRPQPS